MWHFRLLGLTPPILRIAVETNAALSWWLIEAVFIIWWSGCNFGRYSANTKGSLKDKIWLLAVCKQVVSLQLSIICTAASRIPLFIFFPRRPSWFKTSIVTPKTVHRRLTAHTVSPTVGEIFLKNGVKEPTPNYEKIMLASELLT